MASEVIALLKQDASMIRVDVGQVKTVVMDALLRHAVPQSAAALQRDLLVAAELRGHRSHGVLRLRTILERVTAGVTDPMAIGEQRWTGSALLEVDGQQGLGPVVATSALASLRDRVEQTGVAAAAIRHNNHLGVLSWYVEAVARDGYPIIATCTSEALVHPWGGRNRMIGTNPLAIGVPAAPDPLVLDMATGVVSMGKIYDYARRGKDIPLGWAVDKHGRPTTRAQAAADGAISPFGGPKGYALGLALEVMIAALTRSAMGTDVQGTLDSHSPSSKGDVFILFDRRTPEIRDAVGTYLQLIRDDSPAEDADGSGGVILVPGDRALRCQESTMQRGIDIPDDVWEDVQRLARGRVPR